MSDIDVKLLTVFAETYKTGSVSQTAVNLGLSQPTISFNLSKLREHYRDPLFVRFPHGMEPTPFATDLYGRVLDLLASFEVVSKYQTQFDPALANRDFHVALTDVAQNVLLPRWLNRLRSIAPEVKLTISHIADETAGLMQTGEVELAIGYMPQLNEGFYQQRLMEETYIGIIAADHPRLSSRPSVAEFLAEGHIAVTPSGTGHSILNRVLREMRLTRRVMLEVPSYLGVAEIAARTDLVAMIPSRLAVLMLNEKSIRSFALPFDLSAYVVKQHWHSRNHHDAGHRWLRSVVADLFLEDSTSS
ncbi:LysR family transcriptional regulator [Caballeronia sp. TF1N1]|jgi:DNA-binding transcriptional LysR family regulator|uniref:LysR family transcriptional regulator n=1 Tax=Caballeronia sp. TF1N1 TaxID=2878153 RepID=UPI001FD2DFB6|nr:LysR family transcriptional regulator [Caballeronia sp. TF1N1]